MEDSKSAMAHQQQQHQQHLMLQHQQQQQQHQHQQQQHQHQQQQFLLLQQIQQQHKQQQAISRFPSNIDAHLRPLQRPINNQHQQQQQQQNNPNPNILQNPNPMSLNSQIRPPNRMQAQTQAQTLTQTSPPANQAELQMAYQDAWRVCHPDFKRPFSSLEDACERLLPYHVVADYEAEEDDRILDSDTTGQVLSRCQQWDHSIANKVAEFTATFEKQVLAFNIISRKRTLGEFRSEERLLIEQALLQEERRALFEARTEIETRQKAGREAHAANLRMAAMAQAEQARAEMMARAPIRASALGSMGEPQEQEVNPDEMMNGWGNNNSNNNNNDTNNNTQKDEKEPSEDFLNDEERDNGDTGVESDWREGGEFDLNTR